MRSGLASCFQPCFAPLPMEAGDRKDRDAQQKEISATNHTGGPRAYRQDNRVGDQIAGEHPGSLTGAGAEVAGNMGQRDVC